MKSRIDRYGMSAMVFAVALCTQPAFAQEAAPAEAAGPAQDAGGVSGVEDIVVTARRRAETAQSAALAIEAVGGSDLVASGVTDAYALTREVPALTITNGGGSNSSIFMRGVGNSTTSSYADPAIAISYDGVFMGRAAAASSVVFYDLARVEVLKGPQGILYGRNATGGAVNIIPARPELGKLGGEVVLSYGNYDEFLAQGALNVPVADNVAVRVAGTRVSRDGFNRDGTSDADSYGFRGQVLFEPDDQLSIRVGADFTHVGGLGAGATYEGNYQPGPAGYTFTPSGFDRSEGMYTPAANAYRQTLLGAPGFGFFRSMQDRPYQDYDYVGVNAEINYEASFGTFTFIPAWRRSDGSSIFGVPSFNSGWVEETDTQFSAELRLAGDLGSAFDYIVGAYYFDERIKADNTYNQEFVLPLQEYVHDTKSWATFGQLTYNVTDQLRLVGGARYTHDRKDMDGVINNFITFCGGLPPANITPPASFGAGCAAPNALPRYPTLDNPQQTVDWLVANGWIAPGSALTATPQVFPLLNGVGTILKSHQPVVDGGSNSRVTWRAAVEYDIAPRSLLYASFETGYRAGGFQLAEGDPIYHPEYLDAYTIGSKNRFFDGRLQFNVEAFYWKYRNQQITYFTLDSSGVLINSTRNIGRATSRGVDVDIVARPTRTTTLNAQVQYLDAKYDDLHLITASPRDNIGCPFTLTGAVAGGAPVKNFNCSGNQALFAPEWSINLGAEQVVPVGTLELVGTVNTSWRDDQWGAIEYLQTQRVPAYWSTDLSLAVRHPDQNWSLTAYLYNLENNRHRATPVAAPTGQAMSIFSPPRTYGVRFQMSF